MIVKPRHQNARCPGTVLACTAFLLIAGCAPYGVSTITLEEEQISRLKNEPVIHVVRYRPPDFLRVNWNSLNTAEDRRIGAQIASRYALADPALRLQADFATSLEAELGLRNVRVSQQAMVSEEPEELERTLGEGVVIGFKTLEWNIDMRGYSPSRVPPRPFAEHSVGYAARGRLVRLGQTKILWQGVCKPGSTFGRPHYMEAALTERGAQLLKAKLDEEADRCAKELLDQFLKRRPP